MPTYFARKAGNINATDVWATTPSGTASDLFPSFTAGDVLMANSFTITVNVSCNLGSTGQVRNDNANSATAGGSFALANGVTLTADAFAGTVTCVTFSGTAGNSATLVGNPTGGTTGSGIGCNNTGTGTLIVTGNPTGGSGNGNLGSGAFGANNASTGTLIVTGNPTDGSAVAAVGCNNASTGTLIVTGNPTGGGGANANGCNNNSTGTLTITGNCTAGSGSNAHGANNNSTGTLTITGPVAQGGNANLTGGTSTGAFGANNASTGAMFITGPVYASEFDGGVGSANRAGLNFLTGPFYTSTTWGVNPNRCVSWRWATNLVNTTFIEVPTANLAAKRNLVTPDNATNFPAATNVRSGTTYGISGELVGTCAVPSPVSVASGIAVDNTVGTLTTPTADQIKDAVWSATNRTITGGTVDTLTNAPASVTPSDIWSYNARTITGGTVDTLTNAPTVPSASAIASQVRSELSVELGRVDQNISSRLAAADYVAPSAAPSVVDIRTELDANSTKLANLDATVSSRLASSAYTAPTTPPTAAQIATAVEGSLLNEADGQAVLNAIVGAIGNQNLSEVSLVAAVRADLERNGGKLDSIPTTAAPSASTVAGAVRAELGTELGRIDAAISSRLASASYTAPTTPPTAAQNASAVRTELSTELARIDAPISGATAPSAATVASAVRSELSTELGRVDAAVSTRLSSSAATELAAVKAKTDALNTERLANVPTVNILGTLLAQANS